MDVSAASATIKARFATALSEASAALCETSRSDAAAALRHVASSEPFKTFAKAATQSLPAHTIACLCCCVCTGRGATPVTPSSGDARTTRPRARAAAALVAASFFASFARRWRASPKAPGPNLRGYVAQSAPNTTHAAARAPGWITSFCCDCSDWAMDATSPQHSWRPRAAA